MLGSSAGDPNWHQPTHAPLSYTSTWCTDPRRVCPRFASRLPSGGRRKPSGWNPMHQQPPHTPLFASTSAAKSSQVSGVSRVVVYTPPR